MTSDFTDRELFVMGWIVGRLVGPLAAKGVDIDHLDESSLRPASALADAISKGHQFRAITPDLDAEIANAMGEIHHAAESPEPVQPVPQQGIFQFGWYAALRDEPLPDKFK